MTKEEYEKLLKSDYWRGYSYSLIKERDFTCEDCGRRFYNERNKLQVHHLVYRDVNPWSYRPDEVVVLCEECHKRRHGLLTEQNTADANASGNYAKSDTNETVGRDERTSAFGNAASDTRSFNRTYDTGSRYSWPEENEKHFKFKYVMYGLLALLVLAFGYDKLYNQKQTNETTEEQQPSMETQDADAPNVFRTKRHSAAKKRSASAKQDTPAEEDVPITAEPFTVPQEEAEEPVTTSPNAITREESVSSSDEGLSTIELLEKRNHEEVVKQAKRAGVSTKGSTIDILERINHAEVVKQAQRAGVSTKGSTTDILERINHAEVVKQAQRAGVSTKGSTTDILERINHAEVVKQAKQMGVSTEGSTTDILERITRKSLESR